MEDRLERLESKLMLAEDALDELNRTVYRQQQQIERMQQYILQLGRQIQANPPGGRLSAAEEVPPHY